MWSFPFELRISNKKNIFRFQTLAFFPQKRKKFSFALSNLLAAATAVVVVIVIIETILGITVQC